MFKCGLCKRIVPYNKMLQCDCSKKMEEENKTEEEKKEDETPKEVE